jgi:hypothetical protein
MSKIIAGISDISQHKLLHVHISINLKLEFVLYYLQKTTTRPGSLSLIHYKHNKLYQ